MLSDTLPLILTYLKDKKCQLVAVTKTQPIEVLEEAYHLGLRLFGENKVQELVMKYQALPKDIEWHMIGHLQSNKVKQIAPFVSLIHSVDSFSLLKEIDKQGMKNGRVIACLLQIHISDEETKFGLSAKEVDTLLHSPEFKDLRNIQITGLMGMASHTQEEEKIRNEFRELKAVFEQNRPLQTTNCQLKTISMGMSGDYKIAVEEGSNMVRLGSVLFGERNYGH
jgi:pyridoxal phosphate enzyme (YggS family)